MSIRHEIGMALALGCALARGAAAEEPETRGASVSAVGGFEDFDAYGMRHASRLNGMWGVRGAVAVDPRLWIEAGYLGSACGLEAPMSGVDAILVGTTFEVLGRLTAWPGARVRPYAFFGVSWRHYDVTGADFTAPVEGMHDSDELLQVPMGVGIEYHLGAIVIDARFTFRATAEESFLVEDDDYAAMDTWGLQGAVGYAL